MSFFVVASHLCFATSAAFGFSATFFGFLEVHFGKDNAPIREKLNHVYDTLHESSFARLPGELFKFISEFHSQDPRGSLLSFLRHWWAPGALIMLLVADGVLAIWYPQELLEAYRNTRQAILNNMPFTLYDDNVTFALGLIGICIVWVILIKVFNAIDKPKTRMPFEETLSFFPIRLEQVGLR